MIIKSWFRSAWIIIVLGALVGNIGGLMHAIKVVLENEYLAQDMSHLAARTLAAGVFHWTWWGVLLSAAAVAGTIALWPLGRLLRKDWQRGLTAAAVAVPVLTFYIEGGQYINHHYLPGFFEAPSVAANLGLTLLAVMLWFSLSVLADRLWGIAIPRWLQWSRGWVPMAIIIASLVVTQGSLVLIAPTQESPRVNVLLLLVDALRPDRLGAYGYHRPLSPNIDNLAQNGWIFTQAVAPASWTKPSVASLFTSLYPHQHGIGSADWARANNAGEVRVDVLDPALTTLSEVTANGGYHTIAVGNNQHLSSEFGFTQGFDTVEWDLKGDDFLSAPEMHRRFLGWLDRHEEGFFAYLHYIDVHWPYLPPPGFAGLYSGSPPGIDYNRAEFMDWASANRGSPLKLDEEDVVHMSDSYDELIQFVDAEIGKLLGELKARGLYDNTMIILTSDHGEEFLEHGALAHGTSLYDVLLRIPLIIKFPCPGSECESRTVEEQVELIDIMPTILKQARLPMPKDIQGQDLTELQRSKNIAFSERGDSMAMRTTQFKYIYSLAVGNEELYDLQTDPGETHNLVSEHPELATSMRADLLEWVATNNLKKKPRPREVVVDEETLEKLRSLGYIQ